MVAVLEEERRATRTVRAGAYKRFRVATGDLKLGMWVAELDRPWLDTPFLLQGFLIDSQVELDTLRRYCRHVQVDATQSSSELLDDIRQAEARALLATDETAARPQPTPLLVLDAPDQHVSPRRTARVLLARSDLRVSDTTRQRFREFAGAMSDGSGGEPRLLQRAAGWLRRSMAGHPLAGSDAHDLADLLPAGTAPIAYIDQTAFEDELSRARRVLSQAGSVLATLAIDVRAGRPPAFGDVRAAVAAMLESMAAHSSALQWLSQVRDDGSGTQNAGVRTALYLLVLGRHLGLPTAQMAQLGAIGMLADAGKARLPRAILDKPGMLGPAEYAIVKEHVLLGLDALAPCALPAQIVQGIAQHHERLDGSGYPRGLRGERIGIWGRMTAVADSYAALTAPRPYAVVSAPQDALMNLYEWAGTSFDERVVSRFVRALGIFPVGSLVELSNGQVAAVVAQHRTRRLEPQVLVLTAPDKSLLPVPRARDLAVNAPGGVRIVRSMAPGAYGIRLRDFHLDGVERDAAGG